MHAWRELPCILPLTCERSNTSQSCAAPNFIQACHNDHERGIYDQTKKKKKNLSINDNDLISFSQAVSCDNSKKWLNVMKE